jgi:TolB-like protein
MMIFLADQLERNTDRKVLGNTFIVSTFSDLNKLNESSPMGRLIGEDIIHELQVRKWNVFDVRLTRDIVINEAGEFSLSRDIKKLRDTYKIGGIITGTYSEAESSITINARAIDIETGLVVSSAQVLLPVNDYTQALLYDADRLKTMKIVGDTNTK